MPSADSEGGDCSWISFVEILYANRTVPLGGDGTSHHGRIRAEYAS